MYEYDILQLHVHGFNSKATPYIYIYNYIAANTTGSVVSTELGLQVHGWPYWIEQQEG